MEASATFRLCKAQIPDYLHNSEFLRNWEDSDELVEIIGAVLKLDTSVFCLSDLQHLLQTSRYWIVNDIPHNAIKFVLQGREELCAEVLQEFAKDLQEVACLVCLTAAPTDDRWATALQLNSVNCVQYLWENSQADSTVDACAVAAGSGNLKCLEYLHEIDCAWSEGACTTAIQHGQLSCLMYLLHHGGSPPDNLCDVAAEHGQLDCLMYLHDTGHAWSTETCSLAAGNGHLECLNYLHVSGCEWDSHTCERSAANGHESCLYYACINGCVCTPREVCAAAANGHVHILEMMIGRGDEPWVMEVADEAVFEGQLACVQFLHSIGCNMNNRECFHAAMFGQLHCLKYLHEQGVRWTIQTTNIAAHEGELECLKYAVEHGCPYDYETFSLARTQETRKYLASILKLDLNVEPPSS